MEENNKEPKQEDTQEELFQQEQANVPQNEDKDNLKFKPLGEINTKEPKKKKSKAGVLIFILLLLAIILGGLGYYYFKVYTNPKITYQQILKTGLTQLTGNQEEITTVKTKMKLDVNADLNDNYMQDGVQEVLDLINNIDATVEMQMDAKEKKAIVKLATDYENEKLINCDILFDAKNKGTYLKLEQFFNKILKVEMENEDYDELEDALNVEEASIEQEASRSKAIKILNNEFGKVIKDEYCSKEQEKITVNEKEVNANLYILKITNKQLINELETVIKNLKNNDEYLNCYEKKEERKQELEEALAKIEEIDTDEEITMYIKLYKIGLKQELVRINFEVEDKEEKVTLKIEKENDVYSFELESKEEKYCTGTIKIEKLDDNTSKVNFKIEAKDFGTIVINAESSYSTNEEIDSFETEDAVSIEELSQADIFRAYANLLESKLYKILERFGVVPENMNIQ